MMCKEQLDELETVDPEKGNDLQCLIWIYSLRRSSCPNTKPASVVQLDVRPTGNREVAGSAPAWWATFFGGD